MVSVMRWLAVLAACAACKDVTSSAITDARVDSAPRPDFMFYDAALPPDAYAPRACDAPPTFADGLVPSRILHVEPGAINGDGSETAPFGSISAAAAVATPGTWIKLAPGTHATQQFIPNLRGTAEFEFVNLCMCAGALGCKHNDNSKKDIGPKNLH